MTKTGSLRRWLQIGSNVGVVVGLIFPSQLPQFIKERNPQPDFAKDFKLNHARLKRAIDGRDGETKDREETKAERG